MFADARRIRHTVLLAPRDVDILALVKSYARSACRWYGMLRGERERGYIACRRKQAREEAGVQR